MPASYIGIDGGGSTLRVVLVDEQMNVLAQALRGTANPSAIGRDASAALIQQATREVLDARDHPPIAAVGIGIAGASAVYAEAWLRATLAEVLPGVPVAPSMDNEIALVGAHGARRGVLVLSGTGSVAYGVNAAGESAQAGGWGYLLGDEGSGYWLAVEGMRALIRWADGYAPEAERLAARVMAAFGFASPVDAIAWVYRLPPPTREAAQHAQIILDAAAEGDPVAGDIVARGADALAQIGRAVLARLGMTTADIAFAGGLLTRDNALSRAVCALLGLNAIPQPRYAPVVGAALLAKLMVE